MKKNINVPKFKNENEERVFWERMDLSAYADAKDFVPVVFPNLKPTSQAISIRIPVHILARLKEKAHKLNVPYQSLMKQYIVDGVSL